MGKYQNIKVASKKFVSESSLKWIHPMKIELSSLRGVSDQRKKIHDTKINSATNSKSARKNSY